MTTETNPATEPGSHTANSLARQVPPPLPTPVVDDRPIRGWGALLDALLKQPERLAAGLTGGDGGYLTRHLAITFWNPSAFSSNFFEHLWAQVVSPWLTSVSRGGGL